MKSRMMNKLCALAMVPVMAVGGALVSGALNGVIVSAAEKAVTDYSYTITPLLAPFNEFFFVKTDNPDPLSFRFVDSSSRYSDESSIEFDWDDWDETINLYADVRFDDPETGRVNGGYLFRSNTTDGGKVTLQSKVKGRYSWDDTWEDTDVKLTLPALKDDADYLIDTYATKDSFFDNMDAVQAGFSSICLYSGSFIRGDLVKTRPYWTLSPAAHIDQVFYIYSPYSRKDNQYLFASSVYPFRYDSLGFPSLMGRIAQRLDNTATYKWNSNYHYLIDVTCNGKTRQYGGAGNGEGQGLTTDKLTQYFTFGKNGTKITLEGIRELLDAYAAVKMEDDIPREDALTWRKIFDAVGTGTWVRMNGNEYTYLYQNGSGQNTNGSEWGVGHSLYWGGDLGYFSDSWVDGRYIGKWRCYLPGETFEDHPTSKLLLKKVKIPQVKYKLTYGNYDQTTQQWEKTYTVTEITEKEKDACFFYDQDKKCWTVGYNVFDSGCAGYSTMETLVQEGVLDRKYLDMVTLTADEVKELQVDKNTNVYPETVLLYDGSTEPGTSFRPVPINGKDVQVTFSSLRFNYQENTVQVPSVTVTYQGQELTRGKDFSVSYDNGTHIGVGTYTVTVEGMGKYSGMVKENFYIFKPANTLKLNRPSASFPVGKSIRLVASTDPAEAADSVLWTTSDEKVAAVKDGVVKGVGKGTATITATTSNGLTATCKVTVGVALTNKASVSAKTLKLGGSVTVKGSAVGGTSPYQYAVWYRNPNNGKWYKAQDYAKNSTVTIKPRQTGDYTVRVNVKDTSGKVVKKDFTVRVYSLLKNTSTVSSSAIRSGGSVTVNAASSGGLGTKQYAVWYKNPNNGKWYKAQDYSSNSTVLVKPKQTGTYTVRVNVKDERGVVVKKDYAVTVRK